MLVFGDVHADYEAFMRAYKYAEEHNLFFMSLGDLVDRGAFPWEVVTHMHSFMSEGKAGFTIGNHDNKFRRFHYGAEVVFSVDGRRTLDTVGPEKQKEFLRIYTEVVEMPIFSSFFHKFGDFRIVHAASHPCMWEDHGNIGKTAESRFIVGESTGQVDETGYPVRLYNWIEEIPAGQTVIVGHDRMPIHNIPITKPLEMTNNQGGKVIFMDTGGGKGGFLSGVVLTHHEDEFKIDRFVEFK